MTISRRKFFALAAGAAAVRALPAPVVGLAVEPAADWNAPMLVVEPVEFSANERLQRSVTLIETYLRHHGTQYRFTRYLSDTGEVLSEDVRPLRPYEELTLARLDRTRR